MEAEQKLYPLLKDFIMLNPQAIFFTMRSAIPLAYIFAEAYKTAELERPKFYFPNVKELRYYKEDKVMEDIVQTDSYKKELEKTKDKIQSLPLDGLVMVVDEVSFGDPLCTLNVAANLVRDACADQNLLIRGVDANFQTSAETPFRQVPNEHFKIARRRFSDHDYQGFREEVTTLKEFGRYLGTLLKDQLYTAQINNQILKGQLPKIISDMEEIKQARDAFWDYYNKGSTQIDTLLPFSDTIRDSLAIVEALQHQDRLLEMSTYNAVKNGDSTKSVRTTYNKLRDYNENFPFQPEISEDSLEQLYRVLQTALLYLQKDFNVKSMI